jgi:hypothetical protein
MVARVPSVAWPFAVSHCALCRPHGSDSHNRFGSNQHEVRVANGPAPITLAEACMRALEAIAGQLGA